MNTDTSHFYLILLIVHSYWRWLVLLSAVTTIGVGIGAGKAVPFEALGKKVGRLFIMAIDIQFLLGIILYIESPYVKMALSNMAVAMKTKDLRFFAVEHVTMMLLAVAVAHIGWVKAKKAPDDASRNRRLSIWTAVSLVLILGGIPWWRPLARALAF